MRISKREIEAWVIEAATLAGVPIPPGGIGDDEPDWIVPTSAGMLGVEITEVMRPASQGHHFTPVEEETFHQYIIYTAQIAYYQRLGAAPVHVSVYFERDDGNRRNKQKMARSLADCVGAHEEQARPVITVSGTNAPDGFASVTITGGEHRDWWSGECGGTTVSEIYEQVAARIAAKNKLVPTYLSNLAANSELWLLLWSGVAVSRHLPTPFGLEERAVAFDFDRVFWFSALEHIVIEIPKKHDGTAARNQSTPT